MMEGWTSVVCGLWFTTVSRVAHWVLRFLDELSSATLGMLYWGALTVLSQCLLWSGTQTVSGISGVLLRIMSWYFLPQFLQLALIKHSNETEILAIKKAVGISADHSSLAQTMDWLFRNGLFKCSELVEQERSMLSIVFSTQLKL
jgi:hypothetical protein